MKTGEMLAKLKKMANEAGESIFERTTLAAKILQDKEWVMAEFAGDGEKAMIVIESDCFPELSRAFGLRRLLTLLDTFPDVGQWKAHRFNLVTLWGLYEEQLRKKIGERPKIERHRATVADLEERDQKIKELQFREKKAREEAREKEKEVERVRKEQQANIAKVVEEKTAPIKAAAAQEVVKVKEVLKEKESEIDRLRREKDAEIERLKAENAELRGENKALHRMIQQMREQRTTELVS